MRHTLKYAGRRSVSTRRIQTSRLPNLTGDMTLDSDNLRISDAKGPVHVVTRSKDIDLSEIYGDSYVESNNGTINVEPAGAYGVEVRNNKGDVELTLPPDSSATVDGKTHNGDIVTDYGLTVSGDEDKTVTGRSAEARRTSC